jgi:hypothetical protein
MYENQIWEKKMETFEREIATAQETVGEVRLWQAVIVRTIEAWMSGSLRQKRQAESYLFDDNNDFPLVCQAAGLDPDDMRARLSKIRKQENVLQAALI